MTEFECPFVAREEQLAFCVGGLAGAHDPRAEGTWLGRLYAVAHEAAAEGMGAPSVRETIALACRWGVVTGQDRRPEDARISGPEISAFRSEHKLTREDLAALIGVEKKTVRAWEQSRRRPTGTAWKILHILIRGTRGERMLLAGLLDAYDVGTPLR